MVARGGVGRDSSGECMGQGQFAAAFMPRSRSSTCSGFMLKGHNATAYRLHLGTKARRVCPARADRLCGVARRRGFSRQPVAENTRGAVSYRPIRYDAEKQPPHTSEEKQPLRESAAKQKSACSSGVARQKSACSRVHRRRKISSSPVGSDLTPTNPLHQIGDGESIPASVPEVQYMFVRLSINYS